MKGKWISLSLGIILMALAGCPSPTSGGGPGPVVYVAGFYYDGTNYRAAYWKDDGNSIARVVLDDLAFTSDSGASDIIVDANGIVYVSGYYNANSAVYWTDDGGSVVLHDDLPVTGNSKATGIFVDANGIVYLSGNDNNGSNDVAVYWIDDGGAPGAPTEHILHESTAAHATGIYVDSGGVVYASGDRAGPVAVYWRDDGILPVVETDIHTGTSYANAIFAEGAEVNIAGKYAPSGTALAAYWTGGAWQELSSVAGNAWDIVRYGGQAYSAGNYLSGTFQKAAYWAGTVETALTGNLSNTYAFGLYVYEGDVYTAGIQNADNSDSDTGMKAVYWRDGILVDLSAGGGSRANAIFVQ